MLLWAGKQLSHPCRHPFVSDKVFASIEVLSDKVHENVNKVGIERDFVKAKVAYYQRISYLPLIGQAFIGCSY